MNDKYMQLNRKDFAEIFGISSKELPSECIDIINKSNFNYRLASFEERENLLLRAIKVLFDELKVSGLSRKGDWEKGWQENLDEFINKGFNKEDLIPKFVKEKEWIRLNGNYILPEDNFFETSFVKVLRVYIYKKYFTSFNQIYEFGCGTGLNLVAMAELFPQKNLYGLDWVESSCNIVNSLAKSSNINMKGIIFDMFNPDYSVDVGLTDAIFTTGAMEQLGVNFSSFLDYLINKNVGICVHFETMYELYDQNNIFDFVAAKYIDKRGYLKGFMKQLEIYEMQKKIEIIEVKRTFGSFYHDGYSVIVWKPI